MDEDERTIHATSRTSKVSGVRSSPPDGPFPSTLTSRIRKLAQRERDAAQRKDWPGARRAAAKRTVLQEARQVEAARRLV